MITHYRAMKLIFIANLDIPMLSEHNMIFMGKSAQPYKSKYNTIKKKNYNSKLMS